MKLRWKAKLPSLSPSEKLAEGSPNAMAIGVHNLKLLWPIDLLIRTGPKLRLIFKFSTQFQNPHQGIAFLGQCLLSTCNAWHEDHSLPQACSKTRHQQIMNNLETASFRSQHFIFHVSLTRMRESCSRRVPLILKQP